MWAIYKFLWYVCPFCYRKIGGPNVGIYSNFFAVWHCYWFYFANGSRLKFKVPLTLCILLLIRERKTLFVISSVTIPLVIIVKLYCPYASQYIQFHVHWCPKTSFRCTDFNIPLLLASYIKAYTHVCSALCSSKAISFTFLLAEYTFNMKQDCIKSFWQSFCKDFQGWYSETEFHICVDRNFVCLWRRHNCKSQVIDLSPFLRWSLNLWNQLLGL